MDLDMSTPLNGQQLAVPGGDTLDPRVHRNPDYPSRPERVAQIARQEDHGSGRSLDLLCHMDAPSFVMAFTRLEAHGQSFLCLFLAFRLILGMTFLGQASILRNGGSPTCTDSHSSPTVRRFPVATEKHLEPGNEFRNLLEQAINQIPVG